ncbi:DUF1971 domain-containing protein [Hyphococcus luteus]|uniref:DUF1971 domain-containing protein n=1 Tax=Hyphococcus luteus TaxID=2058213 RepID=UPI001A9C5ACE|nr:DUF1971 domain-containing protein [Marinicaulis flavus]
MREDLPDGLVNYGGTPVFTEKTVPAKLTRAHDTKPGVWGKLVVIDGALDYVIPGPPEERMRIEGGDFAIIEPEIEHYVTPRGAVSFRVDFYRAAR